MGYLSASFQGSHTVLAAIPLCLPTGFGGATELPWSPCQPVAWAMSSSVWETEGSQGLQHGLQVSSIELQPGNHAGKPQPTLPGAQCCCPGPQRRAVSMGRSMGTLGVGGEDGRSRCF